MLSIAEESSRNLRTPPGLLCAGIAGSELVNPATL
jgi:hypothetical protein